MKDPLAHPCTTCGAEAGVYCLFHERARGLSVHYARGRLAGMTPVECLEWRAEERPTARRLDELAGLVDDLEALRDLAGIAIDLAASRGADPELITRMRRVYASVTKERT